MADYPAHLARERRLADGRAVTIRPIRAEDEAAEREFFGALSDESRHARFMKFVHSLNEKLVHFFTHIDYRDHMAFVCEADIDGRKRLVGEARYVANAGGESCEFGVVVADEWRKSGIAGLLMQALIAAARERGLRSMEGIVLRDNPAMLKFVRALGFEVHSEQADWTLVRVIKRL